jgi:hypothetical protein
MINILGFFAQCDEHRNDTEFERRKMRRVACGSLVSSEPADWGRTDKRIRAAAMPDRSCILFDASFVVPFIMLEAFQGEQAAAGTWQGAYGNRALESSVLP